MNDSIDIQSPKENIVPLVNAEAEFNEILNDFGNPLEILREAISNSYDARASEIVISFGVREIDGSKKLVIQLNDDGCGISEESLRRDFWGLGHSTSRGDDSKIGEKGHGTKIFLRSEHVIVKTQTTTGAWLSECVSPLRALTQQKLHTPTIQAIGQFRESRVLRLLLLVTTETNEPLSFGMLLETT
ncbi:MAG: ATP-binding protein [Ignavibacteria bacterium]|nr:ATP-binding protein [Ignavibacteria bacterium]